MNGLRIARQSRLGQRPGPDRTAITGGLAEGQQVQVIVILQPAPAKKTGPSALEIIESLKGHRLFQSPEEVDRYINEERNSWER